MHLIDFLSIIQWWIATTIIGIAFLPFTAYIFPHFFDKGYVFSRILGIAIISYTVYLISLFHLLPFTNGTIYLTILILTGFSWFVFVKKVSLYSRSFIFFIIFEEILFFLCLLFWSYIRSFNPDIHGLEKYMDFGFINSILHATYFPPKDMWFTPFSINYYYFGHIVTAILTKFSMLPSSVTFNLMVATICALCFTASFSIGANLLYFLNEKSRRINFKVIIAGIITAFLVTFSGNLHVLYTFFTPYENELPVPINSLTFSPSTFPNAYWYPNATRFIDHTIHEFPIYSWVVSDLHGHVLDIPFVLLTIAVLISLVTKPKNIHSKSQYTRNQHAKIQAYVGVRIRKIYHSLYFNGWYLPLISFLLAIMYMTNAWDGIIYLLLTEIILIFFYLYHYNFALTEILHKRFSELLTITFFLFGSFILFTLPFSIFFKPFVSGIGVLCSPKFLINIGRIGPFLFEQNHCQHSPVWQLFMLYGFFYFFVISFLIFLYKRRQFTKSDIVVLALITLATILIIIPEFIYIKDIYPAHYRANTMFKLVFQAFIILSITSSYAIVRIITAARKGIYQYIGISCFIGLSTILISIVCIYPYLATSSYYANLQTYHGLEGTAYLKQLYPDDYAVIQWINKHIIDQPILLEAQGDSYTDFGRISANTGLPTILGWTVHEWLWRGTYDIPAPRIEEIKILYESKDSKKTKELLKKYAVKLVFVGDLERQKYPLLNEDKFQKLGKVLVKKGNTTLYVIQQSL